MAKKPKQPKGPSAPPVEGAGKGGNVPPPEHRWQPGQSGNPNGRPTAGASLKEWLNVLAAQDLTEDQVRAIARDRSAPWTKRAAAERVLRTLEAGDLADVEAWLRGEKTLDDLRASGVNTELVKKAKIKRIPTQNGMGEEREIELHDRAGADFDRISDRTDGKPGQSVKVDGPGLTAVTVRIAGFDVAGAGEGGDVVG